MKPADAMEEVKKEMEGIFGKGLVGIIVITARNKAKTPLIGMDLKQYNSLVEAICSDNRVMSMFGASGVRQRQTKWKNLAD